MFTLSSGEPCYQYVVEYFDVLPLEHQKHYIEQGEDPFGEDRWAARWSFKKFEDAMKAMVKDSEGLPEWRTLRVKDLATNTVLMD